ncbi:PfkB family carbohydrate kinase [Streptomyces sp. CA-251387]|uniref:sugar kinase n=1 Tax=Streptomyces sp. CA-251387 TaxID=3240064 RepID=UPI003D945C17
MVTFLPSRPGRLADVPSFERGIGGAESNVVCGLAAAGHAVRWVSRVGADGFGDHLVEAIGEYGVDVSAVRRDPVRPTGVYFRTAGDRGTDAHEVAYYRAGSAASAMSVENVDLEAVRAGRVLHLSGITAALSEGCLGLMRELTGPGAGRPLVSFDVNYRPGLWRDADGPAVLLELARGADIVFVGVDEAEEAWGVAGGPEAIRGLLPEPGVLVVKHGGVGATAFVSAAGRSGLVAQFPAPLGSADSRQPQGAGGRLAQPGGGGSVQPAGGRSARPASGRPTQPAGGRPVQPADGRPAQPAGSRAAGAARVGAGGTPSGGGTPPTPGCATRPRPTPTPGATQPTTTFEPALHVTPVATVGAGDAFAAGFLSATLRGLPVKARLRQAHLWAAATLTAPGDLAPPPSRDHADRLVALDDAGWEKLRLGPGWTQAAHRADEEVRTP